MRISFLFLIVIISGSLYGQQEGKQLHIADCIAQALGKNPSLQISYSKVDAAVARSSESNTMLLPQLKLSGRAACLSSVPEFRISPIGPPIFPSITENYSLRLSVQQPVFTGLKLLKNREMAVLGEKAAREDLTKDQSDLVLNVITAYWNLYRAVRVEEVLRQSVQQMAEHLKDINNLEKQGMATGGDVMKVQVQYSDVKVKHIEAKNAIRLASMSLNSLIGNAIDMQVFPADTPEVSHSVLAGDNLSVLQARALKSRPEMKAMNFRREMGSAAITAAKGGWYPQLFLAANYDYSKPNQRIVPPRNQWDGTWDVGLTLQWNIWDWLATGYQTAQAQASLRQTEAAMAQLTDGVMLEVAQQYFNVQTAAEKVEVAVDGVEQGQESYRMTMEKFKNGVASNTDLLDAELALLQAKLTRTQAEVDYTLALSRLNRAIGGDIR
jgi:outer membrane protein